MLRQDALHGCGCRRQRRTTQEPLWLELGLGWPYSYAALLIAWAGVHTRATLLQETALGSYGVHKRRAT